ncbi:MAG: ornithine carbamoyltransferase [archaeon]
MKHFLSLKELKPKEMEFLIEKGIEIKKNPEKYFDALKDKTLLMIFEKPSLRTRVSFEVGMTQLGGHAIYYDVATSPLGKKESISDTAKTASRYVDIIMARMYKQADIRGLAENSSVPVIDALSDIAHPCQITADLQTIKEKKGKLKGLTLSYVGDANNNVTYSLMHGTALVGMNMKIGFPKGEEFEPKKEILKEAEEIAEKTGAKIELFNNAVNAVEEADVVYTDSWMSYHVQEQEKERRRNQLIPFQVTDELMSKAKKDAVFMNCLPAMRGMEQTAEVIDGKQSIVFDQAENRLHAQKAIMLWLLDYWK